MKDIGPHSSLKFRGGKVYLDVWRHPFTPSPNPIIIIGNNGPHVFCLIDGVIKSYRGHWEKTSQGLCLSLETETHQVIKMSIIFFSRKLMSLMTSWWPQSHPSTAVHISQLIWVVRVADDLESGLGSGTADWEAQLSHRTVARGQWLSSRGPNHSVGTVHWHLSRRNWQIRFKIGACNHITRGRAAYSTGRLIWHWNSPEPPLPVSTGWRFIGLEGT